MKKKILSLLTAFAMVFGILVAPFTTASANNANEPGAHKTKVLIHKILMQEHNWNAKKVTLTTTAEPKTSESKVIVKKGEGDSAKYYDAKNMNSELSADNEFVKGFKGEPVDNKKAVAKEVFPGLTGLDGTEFKGQKLTVGEYFGSDSKPINGVAFRIFEVYTGKDSNPSGYTLGSELMTTYKLATNDLESTKYYKLVTEGATDGVFTTARVDNEDGIATASLADGTYRIVEDKAKSTYKGENGETLTGRKAVPFTLVLPIGKPDGSGNYSETEPLNLYPKNTEKKVKFDKNFAKENGLEKITDKNTLKDVGAVFDNYNKEKANAKGEIGKEIKYEAKAFLPKGSVFTKLHLADSMDGGLEYDSKKGVTVAVNPTLNPALDATSDYTVKTIGNGFDITFNQTGIDKLNKAAETSDVNITFTYSAKVTAKAVNDRPMDNHATITYNHTPPAPSSETVKPKDGEITVSKTWADGTAPTGVKVKYVLLDENNNALADVTFTDKSTVDQTDLGHGITFEKTGDFAGKFKFKNEEDKAKQYKIKEIVDGYEPEYVVDNNSGKVTVNNKKTPDSITPTPPQVTVGGKKFVKVDSETGDRLAGAQFVIENNNTSDATNNGKYLKINADTSSTAYTTAAKAYDDAIKAVNDALAKGAISATNKVKIVTDEFDTKDKALAKVAELQKTRDKEFVKAKLNYTWVQSKDEATQFYTNKDGQFEVTGLAYGDYRAVEIKAAPGYALDTNPENFKFTVADGSYTGPAQGVTAEHIQYDATNGNDNNKAQKIVNKKVTIPETGGIGSLIFIVAGLAIMTGAFIAYKKSQAVEA
ncbi:LPXTG-motif cell wall anchor domain protein [Anaerococcus lactolyticus ATCC 51172]|uniref:LPXTG-motif cell wall anchor domain protein n=1 Tax=Anaerococcus lactolyticus ATCC 51172 TaxID=525254 RepID=C2BGP5_9FIRM|nr:pilin N-terminal domain-containing protein [Anaerococcus lactolyticus]EEI85891.1 LPXTG-motif cell wall anchor domain protein [Anaerococcus lactolyticus ATCC 51172]